MFKRRSSLAKLRFINPAWRFCTNYINTEPTKRKAQTRDERFDNQKHQYSEELILQQAKEKRKVNGYIQGNESCKAHPSLLKKMSKLKSCSSTSAALTQLDAIEASGIPMHILAFNFVLEVSARTRDINGCCEVLRRVREKGFWPDAITWSSALKVAHRCRNLEFGLKIWKEMLASRVKPNMIHHNLIISTCAELPEREAPNGFPGVRVEMAEHFFKMIKDPPLISYNALLNVYAKAGLLQDALKLEAEMQFRGVQMSAVTYGTLMATFVLSGDYTGALTYFKKSRAAGELNQINFNTAMQAHFKLNQLSEARFLWTEICERYTPDYVSLGTYVKVLAKEGLIAEIVEVINNDMADMSSVGWYGLINELYSDGIFDEADTFFEKAYGQGKIPIWSSSNKFQLELHRYSGAVACCAVRYVLKRERSISELAILVGRQTHSTTYCYKPVGTSVRELLDSLCISFTERSQGGLLEISSEQVERARLRYYK